MAGKNTSKFCVVSDRNTQPLYVGFKIVFTYLAGFLKSNSRQYFRAEVELTHTPLDVCLFNVGKAVINEIVMIIS